MNDSAAKLKYLETYYQQLVEKKTTLKKSLSRFWFVLLISVVLIIFYPFTKGFHTLLLVLLTLTFSFVFAAAFYSLLISNRVDFKLLELDTEYYSLTGKHLHK